MLHRRRGYCARTIETEHSTRYLVLLGQYLSKTNITSRKQNTPLPKHRT